MAKFCSKKCEETGSICDFCKHYKDQYRDIEKRTREEGKLMFAGSGVCDIDGKETDASYGYKCEDFECFNVKD